MMKLESLYSKLFFQEILLDSQTLNGIVEGFSVYSLAFHL